MREALALITFILLIWVGWKQPYREHFADLLGEPTKTSQRTAARSTVTPQASDAASITAAPSRDSSWMWERSKLDNPNELKGRINGR